MMRLSLLAAPVVALVLAGAAAAQEPPPRQILVVGQAEVEAVPDLATITAGVETQAPTAAEALSANSTAMTAVFAALAASGVAERDMQTSQLSISPVYEPYREGADPVQRVVAYQAANMVTVRVRDVAGVGATVDALTEAGGNRLYGIAFEVSDPRAKLDSARTEAVADARAKAELYATAAGVTLGPVQTIRETTSSPGPVMMRAEAAFDAAPPVAQGTVTLSTEIEIVYAIE